MPGRVVLVTRAARGIAAAALRLPGEEAEVGYRMATRTELEQLAAGCGDAVVAHVADIRDRAGLQAGVDLALERWGRLDAAVAAAAVIFGGQPL